jgi:hypothetical protein
MLPRLFGLNIQMQKSSMEAADLAFPESFLLNPQNLDDTFNAYSVFGSNFHFQSHL